ncbi:MAG: sigma factor [Culicoidibacterales bacterium]
MGEPSYDELYYLACEKNEMAEKMLCQRIERYLQWLCFVKANDFLRTEDIMSYGWQGYIDAMQRYLPGHNTTFKTFAQFCIKRRLIDVQRGRNKRTMKAHMTSLLISDEKVAYTVETRYTTQITDENMIFETFWKQLVAKERLLLSKYTFGESIDEMATYFQCSNASIYKKIRGLRTKLVQSMSGNQ